MVSAADAIKSVAGPAEEERRKYPTNEDQRIHLRTACRADQPVNLCRFERSRGALRLSSHRIKSCLVRNSRLRRPNQPLAGNNRATLGAAWACERLHDGGEVAKDVGYSVRDDAA